MENVMKLRLFIWIQRGKINKRVQKTVFITNSKWLDFEKQFLAIFKPSSHFNPLSSSKTRSLQITPLSDHFQHISHHFLTSKSTKLVSNFHYRLISNRAVNVVDYFNWARVVETSKLWLEKITCVEVINSAY